jgi:DNA-binding MarR family transcriptional regulator
VRRERDESDRRKVFIATVPENIAKVGKFYEHMQRAVLKDWESYSDTELRLLLRFMTQGYKTMLAATEELKAMMEPPKGKRAGSTKPARTP